jgi:hypothetical protein
MLNIVLLKFDYSCVIRKLTVKITILWNRMQLGGRVGNGSRTVQNADISSQNNTELHLRNSQFTITRTSDLTSTLLLSLQIFTDCKCVKPSAVSDRSEWLVPEKSSLPEPPTSKFLGGITFSGSCPIDCSKKFIIFLAVMCLLKFSGSSGRASNFLLSVR